MPNNIDENNLLTTLREYIERKGYEGFFGLIAKLSPENVDKRDLNDYNNDATKVIMDTTETSSASIEQFKNTSSASAPIKEASIYAEEHIPAVREDMLGQNSQMDSSTLETQVDNLSKVRVLEPSKNSIPNAFQDAEEARPGQLKL